MIVAKPFLSGNHKTVAFYKTFGNFSKVESFFGKTLSNFENLEKLLNPIWTGLFWRYRGPGGGESAPLVTLVIL